MHPLPGVVDVVPAICTLALHYDPLKEESVADGANAYAVLAHQVSQRLLQLGPLKTSPPTTYEIPVCYGGAFGEDLEELAQSHALSVDEVIALHTAPLYRVQMLGFAPGFRVPRRAGSAACHTHASPTPRTSVPAGSVAIGGELTGIYPLDSARGLAPHRPFSGALFDPRRSADAVLRWATMCVSLQSRRTSFSDC